MLRRTPLQQLHWCTELKFMDQDGSQMPYVKPKTKNAFPFRLNNRISAHTNQQKQHNANKLLDILGSSTTISDKNEFIDNRVIALSSFPGSGNTWLRYFQIFKNSINKC